jgi:hypothetical protein
MLAINEVQNGLDDKFDAKIGRDVCYHYIKEILPKMQYTTFMIIKKYLQQCQNKFDQLYLQSILVK